jgi:hypothetical protein
MPIVHGKLDAAPLAEELNKAINSLAARKFPYIDVIRLDLLKQCKNSRLLPQHEIFCQFLKEGSVPQKMGY